MAAKQFQLDGPSLEGLKARILAEHGSRARVISAEKVRVGGVWGFFAREHFEVTVEVPERTRRGAHVLVETPPRAGIASLLNDADDAEAQLHGAEAGLEVSTGSDTFAKLMDDLTFNTAAVLEPEGAASAVSATAAERADESMQPAAAASSTGPVRPTGPAPLNGAGDLVAVVGLADDALFVAKAMAAAAGVTTIRAAGAVTGPGIDRLEDRASAMAARARGVGTGQATFVAFGMEPDRRNASECAAVLSRVGADQLWVAVNAGRKAEDTALWVASVTAALPVLAMAVVGCDGTQTPHTVSGLGLPAGWVDGATDRAPGPQRAPRRRRDGAA